MYQEYFINFIQDPCFKILNECSLEDRGGKVPQ